MYSNGLFAGACMLVCSGIASHGGGRNQGLSKALVMVFVLFVCPGYYTHAMDWLPAWTAINMTHFREQFRPIINALAIAADHHFYVSYSQVHKVKSISPTLRILSWVSNILIRSSVLSSNTTSSCRVDLHCFWVEFY